VTKAIAVRFDEFTALAVHGNTGPPDAAEVLLVERL
jgi:hypothetical protein